MSSPSARTMTPRRAQSVTLLVAIVGVALLAACGGKETMASKSAAAYRDAAAKETLASGGAGRGHEHGDGAPAAPVVDHSAHSAHTMTPDAHASMGHADTAAHSGHGAGAEHAEHAASADAHAKHGATPDAHAGMQHDSRASASVDHSQHAAPDAHAGHNAITPAAATAMDHGAHSKAAALPPHSIEVPNANSEMVRVQ